ncbi:MAG: CBS domain-containing protein, partial [Desulfobacterales bacterium]
MRDTLVKDVMIPIADYVTVKKEHNLTDVLLAFEKKRQTHGGHAHRDAIVVDEGGRFVGKVTIIDIFRSLEPNYRKVRREQKGYTLTDGFVKEAIKEFKLWMEPAEDICQRGSKVTVAEAMHVPEKSEYIKEDDNLEKALNYYVMGVHQPLIVKKGEDVTGVLRFGDIFEIVRERLLSCYPV